MNSVERVRTAIKLGTLTALLLAPLAALSAQTKAPAKPDPNFIASPADLKARIPTQLHITKPDFVVFVPEVTDDGVNDTGNEHFLVFDGPDGSLMAVWTQSSAENFSPGDPAGSAHRVLAEPTRARRGRSRASSPDRSSGRRPHGELGLPAGEQVGPHLRPLQPAHRQVRHVRPSHRLAARHLQRRQRRDMVEAAERSRARAASTTTPTRAMPPNMLCWQKPLRLGKDGKYFAGFTRWTSFGGAERTRPSHGSRRLARRVHALRERGRQSRVAQT